MSSSHMKNSNRKIDESLQGRLRDYPCGYLLPFDFYPNCNRHLFARNDAYALAKDFWAVSREFNDSIRHLIESETLDKFTDHGHGRTKESTYTACESERQ